MVSVCPKRNFPLSCSIWWSTDENGGKSATTSQAEGHCQVHSVLTHDLCRYWEEKESAFLSLYAEPTQVHTLSLLTLCSGQLGLSTRKIPRPLILKKTKKVRR